jgi:MFS family permease
VALGLGRGANGVAGPFGPVEQAWLARVVPHAERARVFSLNNAAAFAGMGAGALLAGALALLPSVGPGARLYLPMFALTGAIAVANAAQLWGLSDPGGTHASAAAAIATRAARAPSLPNRPSQPGQAIAAPPSYRSQNRAFVRLGP